MPRPRNDGTPARAANKLRLTDPFIRAIVPAAERTLHWDALVPGLALAVTPNGFRSWRFTYRAGGRLRVFSIGRFEGIGLAAARDRARVLLGQVAEGKDPAAEKQRGIRAELFEDVASRYREHAMKVNRSWEQAARLVAKHLMPRWAKLRARDVTRTDVRSVVRQVSEGGAPILANQVLAAASAIFTWAIRQEVGDVLINPCIGIDRNAVRARDRVLSETEVPLFWRAFDAAGLVCGTALKVTLLTGQRPGEVASMRWDQIGDGGWWNLAGLPDAATAWPGTRGNERHRVWLTAEVRRLMAESGTGSAFVFPGDARGQQPLDESRMATAMRRISRALAVKDPAKPHDLRRTNGTMITALGYGRDAMNRLQNHRDGGIASVYDRHGYGSENQGIMEHVTRQIMSLVGGEPEGGPVVVTVGERTADVVELAQRRRA